MTRKELIDAIMAPMEKAEFPNRDRLVKSLRSLIANFGVEDLTKMLEKGMGVLEEWGGPLDEPKK